MVLGIDLAARKHIGAAQHLRGLCASHQQHLQAVVAVAQQQHRCRIDGWGGDGFEDLFHGGFLGIGSDRVMLATAPSIALR